MLTRRGLRNDLKEHHISWITFGATVGFGLTIRSGQVLSLAGPFGLVIVYCLLSILAWALMGPFVEMSSVVPVNNGAYELPAIFLDGRLGTTLGYMFLFAYLMVYAEEIAMTSRLMDFCYPNLDIHSTLECAVQWGTHGTNQLVWAFLTIGSSFAVNAFPVKWYGRIEHACGVIKITGLVVVILAQLVILQNSGMKSTLWGADANKHGNSSTTNSHSSKTTTSNGIKDIFQIGEGWNGSNAHERLEIDGGGAKLLEIWTGLTFTIFSLLGIAAIPVAAAEAKDRGKDLKSANRKTLLRVISISIIGTFLVSFNVPHNHINLLWFGSSKHASMSQNSPFMIAIVEAGHLRLAHFANVVFVFSTWSCSVANMFITSRTLYSLCNDNHMPVIGKLTKSLGTTNKHGVPLNALILCALWGFFGVLGIGDHSEVQRTLDRMAKIGSICCLIVLMWLCVTFTEYYKFLKSRLSEDMPINERARLDRDYEPNPSNTTLFPERQFSNANSSIDFTINEPPDIERPRSSHSIGSLRPQIQHELPANNSGSPSRSITDNNIHTDTTPSPSLEKPVEMPDSRITDAVNRYIPTFAYRTSFQPWRAYIGALVCFLILLFEGWHTFHEAFGPVDGITAYIAHMVFFALWFGLKGWDVFRKGWGTLRPLFGINPGKLVLSEFKTGEVELKREDDKDVKDYAKIKRAVIDICKGIWWWLK